MTKNWKFQNFSFCVFTIKILKYIAMKWGQRNCNSPKLGYEISFPFEMWFEPSPMPCVSKPPWRTMKVKTYPYEWICICVCDNGSSPIQDGDQIWKMIHLHLKIYTVFWQDFQPTPKQYSPTSPLSTKPIVDPPTKSPSLMVRLIPFKTSLPAIVTCKFSTSKIGSSDQSSPKKKTRRIAHFVENKNERSRQLGGKWFLQFQLHFLSKCHCGIWVLPTLQCVYRR